MGRTILVAGASGVIGRRLVPLLVDAGHEVVGTTRTEQGARTLRELGAKPVVVDVLDAEALLRAVTSTGPEVVMHQLTALSAFRDGRVEEALAANAHVRTVGTRNLVNAALAAGTRRMIAQSIAWVYAPRSPQPHAETDPLDLHADGIRGVTVRGVAALEDAVLRFPVEEAQSLEHPRAGDGVRCPGGVVLRYGRFYGPGTGRDDPPDAPAVHVDAAAHAALVALERGDAGAIFNIAEPGEAVSTAQAATVLGFRPDFRVPQRLLRER